MELILIQLDQILQKSFKDFTALVIKEDLIGREQEMKSFYCSNILLPLCSQNSVLKQYSQIVLEGAVPQVKPTEGYKKGQVNFDMLIWEKPNQVCFDATGKPIRFPLAILEWKVSNAWGSGGTRKGYEEDIAKIRTYTEHFQQPLLGYALWLDHREKTRPIFYHEAYYKGKNFDSHNM